MGYLVVTWYRRHYSYFAETLYNPSTGEYLDWNEKLGRYAERDS